MHCIECLFEVNVGCKQPRPELMMALYNDSKCYDMFSGMTHRGHIRQSYGGVGRNIGDALARLGCRPLLISAVGDDTHARALTAHNPKLELGGLARVGGASTAVYCVVLDQAGEALFGVGDMSVHERVTPGHVSPHRIKTRSR
nr:uncharacterized protein LOC113805480 [Penaeus vannamei]